MALPLTHALERATRYQLLERLVHTRGVVVDDIDAGIDALEQFRLGGDLADQLILARATNTGVELLPSRCVLPAPMSVQQKRGC